MYSLAIEAIKAVINATWTDIETKFEGQASVEYGWRELVQNFEASADANKLKPPFATLNWGEARPSSQTFGTVNHCYEIPVVVGYITGRRNTTGGTKKKNVDFRDELFTACELLQKAILSAGDGSVFLCYQCGIDSSEMNAANDYLATTKLPFRAAFVRATIYVGYTP